MWSAVVVLVGSIECFTAPGAAGYLTAVRFTRRAPERRARAQPPRALAARSRGPKAGELRRLLAERGVDASGIFERSELLRLLAETRTTAAAAAAADPQLETMSVQDVMAELQRRGIGFDVLAPDQALYEMLRKARSKRAAEGSGTHATTPAKPTSATTTATTASTTTTATTATAATGPSRATASPATTDETQHATASRIKDRTQPSGAKPQGDARMPTRGASEHRDLLPLIGDTMQGALEWLEPTVSGAVDRIAPVAAAATSSAAAATSSAARVATGARPRAWLAVVRKRLRRVRPPPKPVLLLLCVSALRFGLVRTALAAISVKLAVEVCGDSARVVAGALRSRRGGETSSGSSAEPQGSERNS